MNWKHEKTCIDGLFFAIDREKWYHLRRIAIAYRHHPATICSEGGKKVNDVENIKMV